MSWMTPGNVFRPFSASSDWPFRSLFDDFDMDEFFGRGTGTAGSFFGESGRRPLDRLRRARGLRESRYTGSGDSSAIGGGDYYVRSPPSPTGSSRSYFSSRSTSDTVTTTPAGGASGSAAHTAGSTASATPTSTVTSAALSTGRNTESPHQKTWTTAIDLVGFKPEEIAVKCEGYKLRIRARREEGEDLNEVRRTLTIPAEVDAEKVSTILTMEGALVVKAPLLQASQQHQRGGSESTAVGGAGVDDNMSSCSQQDLSWDDVRSLVRGPGIQPLSCLVSPRSNAGGEIDSSKGDSRMFKAEILVREFHPQEIKVRQKGDQVYIEAESRQEREGQTELRRLERSFTLPRGVDVENLVSRLTEDGRLQLEAPFVPPADGSASAARSVPIEGAFATTGAAAVTEQPAGSGGSSSGGDSETKKD